jgi:hypothetical protein
MHSSKALFPVIGALMAALAVSNCAAQVKPGKNTPRILPPTTEIVTPFAVDVQPSERMNSVAFLPEDSMAPQDRQIVRDGSPTIRKEAGLQGFELDRGKWVSGQILCPVLPGHIVLLFNRNDGVGDVSEFSAALPRDGIGSIFIVPILRRSYSAIPAVPINPLTIAVFNRLRAQDHPDRKVDWLTTGLCYAALTGAHVELSPSANSLVKPDISFAMDALLQIDQRENVVVHFTDHEEPQSPREWNLTFNKKGVLVDVAVIPLPALKARLLPKTKTDLHP